MKNLFEEQEVAEDLKKFYKEIDGCPHTDIDHDECMDCGKKLNDRFNEDE